MIDIVSWHGQEKWDRTMLEAGIKRAVDWVDANNAALICNDFAATWNTHRVRAVSI